jgi:selenide,water dikinase
MGGRPVLAIAILGWPVGKLAPAVAQKVIEGGRSVCAEAGIPLAGGHSIDSPEPIFGLAVNGMVDLHHIKKNNEAKEGDLLFLTKPLGVGMLTTAEKKGILKTEHQSVAARQMMQLNKAGEALGKISGVHALTDVTGFGLLGHLAEMADGSDCSAVIYFNRIPLITEDLLNYFKQNAVPGGTQRNWDSYGGKISFEGFTDYAFEKAVLADPQTSGGLLAAVSPEAVIEMKAVFRAYGLNAFTEPVGRIVKKERVVVNVIP